MALTNKGCFKIGNTEFHPKKLNISYESIASESSGRTDDGVMHITWIKSSLPKLEIEMPPCSAAEVNSILSLVQGQIYNITYWDVKTNTEKTVNVYTSTSSANCYSGILNSGSGLYEGVSFNAIATGA